MQDSFFNAHSGLTPLYWWLGQIVDETTWKGNEKHSKFDYPDQIPGFGTRYKVRIFGRDSSSKDTPDDQLEMAEILYPVTGGSGHGGGFQSANLSQGTWVFGFYKDGVDATEPIIMGCLGNNDQTELSQKIPLTGFVPFSGYNGTGVPFYAIPPGGSPARPGPKPWEGISTKRNTVADQQILSDAKTAAPISSKCEPIPATGIQLTIKNLIKDIEKAKKDLASWQNAALKPINYNGQQMSPSEYIQMKISNASKDISKFFKDIIEKVRKFITEKVNNTMKDTYYLVYPNKRPDLKKKIEKANDLISCLFNKIISNLLKMIGNALLAMADRVINVAECLVNNLIGGLLGKLIGLITSAINNILKPIEGIVGSVFGIANDVLGIITTILGLFSCEEESSCSELKEWSIFDGPKQASTIDVNGILNKAQSVASNFTQIIDPENFDFNLDFSDIFTDSCNIGPILCGPPKIEFYGGGGSGTTANAIISATGDILGVDIITPGSGYSRPPVVIFNDPCGKGSGAYGRAILGTVGTTTGVIAVIPESSGSNYLSTPDGSQGGDGRTWAGADDSTIQNSDGTYQTPFEPGQVMNINPGDTVQLAGQSPYVATEAQTITAAPRTASIFPETVSGAQYPIYLSLCEAIVTNPGLNYSPNDKIIVEPSNGAVLEPVFGSFGTLEKINITSVGVGYTERPNIYIQSETGYNAVIVPKLCVNRIKDLNADVPLPVPQEQVIHVVDCVGKV